MLTFSKFDSIKAVFDRRIRNGFGHEVWEYRNDITNLAKELAEDVTNGRYVFESVKISVKIVETTDGMFEKWEAKDSVVLKTLEIILKWTFKNAIRKVNAIISALKLEKAKNKTFIGKVKRGFDFLGFNCSPSGMSVAKSCIQKFAEQLTFRFYEADRRREKTKEGCEYAILECVSKYVQRWLQWVGSIYNAVCVDGALRSEISDEFHRIASSTAVT